MQRSALFCTCLAGLVAAALFACPAGALAATTVIGTVTDASGTVLASGTIIFTLSQEGIVTDPALLITPPVQCTITAGVIQSCSLRGNDEISPAGTVYRVRIQSTTGRLFMPERTYSITGATWDIGQQTPNPSSVQDGIHGASLHSGDVIPPANQEFGAFYSDFSQIAVPANPAAGTRRLFVDDISGELSVRTSAGVTVSLEAAGGGGGATHQIDGVDLTTQDPINFLDTSEFDWTNPAAGDISLALKSASIADSKLAAISDRTKLPAAIAYEDEANIFTAAQQIKSGANVIYDFPLSGDTAIRNWTDQSIFIRLDSGNTASQIAQFIFGDRGTNEWILRKSASQSFLVQDAVGGVDRLALTPSGASILRTGSTSADHDFESSTTLRVRIHGDAPKISFGSAADVSFERFTAGIIGSKDSRIRREGPGSTSAAFDALITGDTNARISLRADGRASWGPGNAALDVFLERTSDPNTVIGLAITAGSVFGLPAIASDPNTATWGTGQDGRVWFQNTADVPRIWDGAAIKEFSLLGQTIEDGELASDYSGVGSCTNQFVRATVDNAAPTCDSIADADLPTSNALDSELHAQSHVLSGSDHTASGLTIGYVVRATAATTFAWQQLGFSDLSGSATAGQVPNLESLNGTLDVSSGGTGAAPGAGDQVLISDSSSAATWRAIPNCNTVTEKTFYNTATNTWTCEADAGAGGGAPVGAQYVVGAADATLTAEKVLTDGRGIDTVLAGGDGGTATINLNYADTLAGNPTFAAKECVFTIEGASGGGFLCEGSVGGNSNEQLYLFPALDGADTTAFIALGASDGDALAGDSATSFFDTGTLEDARLSVNVPLASDNLGFFAATTVAQLATVLSDENYTPGSETSAEGVLDHDQLQLAGLTAGQVYRATSATTAGWGALDLADADARTGLLPDANLADVLANTIMLRNAGTTGVRADVKISALTEEATPLSGDWILGETAEGNLRRYDVGNLPTGGGGEANTHSSDGGGLALTAATPKVGVDLRLVSLAAADFDLAADLFTIDDTKWAKDSELHTIFSPNADPGVDHSGLSGGVGITEVGGALSFDAAEIGTETWLDNADRVWTFDIAAAGVNPTIAFAASSIELDANLTVDDEQELRLKEEDAGGENYVGFKAPAAITANGVCALLDSTTDIIPDTCVGGILADELIALGSEVSGTLPAGSYDAASIDGDDIATSLAGTGLTLTPASPDTLDCDAASTTAVGCPELATIAETDTGTDSGRVVTPDGLAGSVFGQVDVQMVLFDFTTAVATGDGKFYFHIATGSKLIGMNLIDVIGSVITVSSSGAITVDVARCAPVATGNACSGTVADVLSTNLTIDANEDSSDTAATDAVIAGASDDVIVDQTWRIDVDGAGAGTQGLIVTLIFQLP